MGSIHKEKMRSLFTLCSILVLGLVILASYFISIHFLWSLIPILPIIFTGFYDMFQKKHSILRNFPFVGRSRYMAEWLRPKLYQYFIESDTEGTPISRMFRSIVYQRAKKVLDTAPFGTQVNVYGEGYEWMNHSINALDPHTLNHHPRVLIGGKSCKEPYNASILNISAMSYGSLSKAAIEALNGGALKGEFAHNTGEGGISPYHNSHNGDLIYQIGTGYFGSRGKDGNFSDEEFAERTAAENVKMIEIKLSQGAKPGHGGILPAKKVTREIAEIRNIEMGKDVISPPFHKAFNTPIGLLEFVAKCRELSGGKPVGFKLCVGHKYEFLAICKAMVKTGITPDFIAVDGGEGGTGAAPLEFSNSVGMPYREGLAFIYDALVGFNLKRDVQLIACGKIFTGFHIFRAFALGADSCYSARGMMLALGCIQALECNKNTWPVGVTTQDEKLVKGLVIAEKKERVANFHKETVESFVELLAAAGLKHQDQITRQHLSRRGDDQRFQTYAEIYPYISEGCLLNAESVPHHLKRDLAIANAESFQPRFVETYIEED